jgi:hypothetical protein
MKSGHTSAQRSVMRSLFFGSVGFCAVTGMLGCSSSAASDENGETGGFGGFANYPQGGFPQGGFPQGGAPQGGFPQGGFPQGGFPQGGAPQGGFPQGGFPQGGFPQGGAPQGGFPQGGFPQGGAPQGGAPQGGFPSDTGGAPQGGSTGTGGAPAAAPPCLTAATQGVIMGDSYVTGAASPPLQPALNAIYPFAAGFSNVAVAGTAMASGGLLGLIPPQWNQVKSLNPKFAIMDGGGNDILICNTQLYPGCSTDCKNPGATTHQTCKDIVAKATEAASTMMMTAANDGLRDVVYFFYPHLPKQGGVGPYWEISDYAEPIAKASCEGAFQKSGGKLNCYWVSMVAPFAAAGGDGNPLNFALDGIHPSDAGQRIIATEIDKVMKAHCVGQQSGCCAP